MATSAHPPMASSVGQIESYSFVLSFHMVLSSPPHGHGRSGPRNVCFVTLALQANREAERFGEAREISCVHVSLQKRRPPGGGLVGGLWRIVGCVGENDIAISDICQSLIAIIFDKKLPAHGRRVLFLVEEHRILTAQAVSSLFKDGSDEADDNPTLFRSQSLEQVNQCGNLVFHSGGSLTSDVAPTSGSVYQRDA